MKGKRRKTEYVFRYANVLRELQGERVRGYASAFCCWHEEMKKKKSVRKNREDGVTDRKSCSWSGVHSWGGEGGTSTITSQSTASRFLKILSVKERKTKQKTKDTDIVLV